MTKISASIVIYNEDQDILQRVIESYLAIELDRELIIVDNSPKSMLGEFCESYGGVRYIFSGKNIGFGAGHNLALAHLVSPSDIHLVINPDTYFDAIEIKDFILWLSDDPDIVLAIPQILNPDGSIQRIVRNIPTPLSLLKRKLHIDDDTFAVNTNDVCEIPFAHGCFFAFRTDVFHQLGGFDERFFMYMEDVDICMRAKEFGKTLINPNYKIYHEYRKGSSKSLKLFCYHFTSVIKFFWKYR